MNSTVTFFGMLLNDLLKASLETLRGEVQWMTHAIDTSWSCAHAPLAADLDGSMVDMEINPLICLESDVIAVDALIRLAA